METYADDLQDRNFKLRSFFMIKIEKPPGDGGFSFISINKRKDVI